jgi:DNA-binding CsgD family transcriptional regulator
MGAIWRRPITWSNQDDAIAAHWRAGLDTFEIARELGVHESVVANRLTHLRQEAHHGS